MSQRDKRGREMSSIARQRGSGQVSREARRMRGALENRNTAGQAPPVFLPRLNTRTAAVISNKCIITYNKILISS